ncbi:hypothetical protein D3C74_452290 [compost metagenome]
MPLANPGANHGKADRQNRDAEENIKQGLGIKAIRWFRKLRHEFTYKGPCDQVDQT